MNYSLIRTCDVANGEGVRVSLFVSGCPHHCKGCFNEETWDFNYGKEFTKKEEDFIIENLRNPYIKGLTLIGGEPLAKENLNVVLNLVKRVVNEFNGTKNIWCYTGYIYENIKDDCTIKELLSMIDVLVDGPFIEELKDIRLKFRGSSNQRIIIKP